MSDLEKLNIVLAVRDREIAKAMDRNTRLVARFAQKSQKNLSNTSKRFDLMGSAAKRLGPVIAALGAGAVIGSLKRTVATLDDIGKTADKMGLTTDALQELRAVAEGAGIAQSSLDSSMERFNKRLGEAALGTGAASKALKQMGLDAGELATMGLDGALSLVADKIAAMVEPTERAAMAAALFGREGVAMVNLLREGSAGMEKMRQEARDLGIVLDESVIRGAEDAQTQLDLMGRVISANVNNALINLAPLLVGASVLFADFARFIGTAIEATENFLYPQTALQLATDNVVAAMADEITQSQVLETALGNGINLSVTAAQTKLEEAQSRHENVKAIIAEQRALALGSDEWASLTEQMAGAQSALNTIGFHGDKAPARTADAYEEQQLHLAALITKRQALLDRNQALDDQLARSAANIATLETGIASASGGVVNIDGTHVSPIEAGPRAEISGTGSAAAVAVPELTNYADVMARIQEVFGQTQAAGDEYSDTMAKLQALYDAGEISAEEYANAVGVIEAKFDGAAAGAKRLEDMASNAFVSIVTGSESAGDAVSGLLSQLAAMAAKSAFSGLFGGSSIFESLAPIFTGASFDGGGDTGSGPRSGGLDGKGGFLAMMHPQESVIDHTKGQSAPSGGGGSVSININVNGARGNSEITDMVEAGVRQGLTQYDRSVLPQRVNQISRDPRGVG